MTGFADWYSAINSKEIKVATPWSCSIPSTRLPWRDYYQPPEPEQSLESSPIQYCIYLH